MGKKVAKRFKFSRFLFFWFLVCLVLSAFYLKSYANQKLNSTRKIAKSIYRPSGAKKVRNTSQILSSKKPISILLMGTDTGALGRTFQGRTDTMMIVVLNPKTETMTIVSIPRDTKVAVYNYEDYFPSKINSAYLYGGAKSAVKTAEKYLNIPIDFYATINMGGMETLINSVGGLDLKPLLTFSYAGESFTKNKQTHMNGKRALTYVRMRYDDPLGDFGRQARQRQVLTALAFKSVQLKSLLNNHYLETMANQLSTDITFNDFICLGLKYRVATHHMSSTTISEEGKIISGQDFGVPTNTEKQKITDKLRAALELSPAETGSTLENREIDIK